MYFKNAVLIATLLQINVFIEITYVVCVICINISQLEILVTLIIQLINSLGTDFYD